MDDRLATLSVRRFPGCLISWLLLWALSAALLTQARAETRLEGTIAQDQTWESAHGPYRIAGKVRIATGTLVRIEPGVVVHFEKGGHLEVRGTLCAEEAVFYGGADMYNREHLIFHGQSRGRLTRCVVQNLALELRSSRVEVTHSAISNRNGSGITVAKVCQPIITRNDFHGNSYYAVYKEGDDTLRTPRNYWGSLDGPSGAGPGRGDAVNPTIDFMPFERGEIGEHLVLVNKWMAYRSIRPGDRLTLTYGIANLNSFAHTVILGASIYHDPARHIHSPAQDLAVTVEPGYHEFSRGFALPETLSEGDYTLLWGVMKADLTAYYALEEDPARLHIGGTPTAPPDAGQQRERSPVKPNPR